MHTMGSSSKSASAPVTRNQPDRHAMGSFSQSKFATYCILVEINANNHDFYDFFKVSP